MAHQVPNRPLKPIEYIPPDVLVTETFETPAPEIGPTELLSCTIAPLMQIADLQSIGVYDGKLNATTTFTFNEDGVSIAIDGARTQVDITGFDLRDLFPNRFAEPRRLKAGDTIIITNSPDPNAIGAVYTINTVASPEFLHISDNLAPTQVIQATDASVFLTLTTGTHNNITGVPAGSSFRIQHSVVAGTEINEEYSLGLRPGAILDLSSVRLFFRDSANVSVEVPGPNTEFDVNADIILGNEVNLDRDAFTVDALAGTLTVTGASDPDTSTNSVNTGTITSLALNNVVGLGTLFLTDPGWPVGEGIEIGDLLEIVDDVNPDLALRFRFTAIPTTITETNLAAASNFLSLIEGDAADIANINGHNFRITHSGSTVLSYTDSFTGQQFVYNQTLTGNQSNVASPLVVSYRAIRTDLSFPEYRLVEMESIQQIDDEIGPIVPENPLAFHMAQAIANTNTRVTGIAVAVNPGTLPSLPSRSIWNQGTIQVNALDTITGTATLFLTENGSTVISIGDVLTVNFSPTDVRTYRFINTPVITETSLTHATLDLLEQLTGLTTFPSPAGGTYEIQHDEPVLGRQAFQEAIEAAGQFDVYSLCYGFPQSFNGVTGRYAFDTSLFNPGEHNEIIALINQDLLQHVTERSLPENKGERIATVINPNFFDAYLEPGSTVSKSAIAAELAIYAEGFSDRRFYILVPWLVETSVEGTARLVSGTALASAISGMDSFYAPQQGFTNLPMIGFSSLRGSNDFFTPTQLNAIAQDGNYIVVQEGRNTPVFARHQLSSNRTQVTQAERSIAKQVDYGARIIRRELKPYIGKFNITSNVVNLTRVVIESSISFLVDSGNWASGTILQHQQNETFPDRLTSTVRVGVLFPLNYIDLEFLV